MYEWETAALSHLASHLDISFLEDATTDHFIGKVNLQAAMSLLDPPIRTLHFPKKDVRRLPEVSSGLVSSDQFTSLNGDTHVKVAPITSILFGQQAAKVSKNTQTLALLAAGKATLHNVHQLQSLEAPTIIKT